MQFELFVEAVALRVECVVIEVDAVDGGSGSTVVELFCLELE